MSQSLNSNQSIKVGKQNGDLGRSVRITESERQREGGGVVGGSERERGDGGLGTGRWG